MSKKSIICLESDIAAWLKQKLSDDQENPFEHTLSECHGTPAELLPLTANQEAVLLVIGDAAARVLPLRDFREVMAAGELRVLVVSKNVQDPVFHEFLAIGCDGVVPRDATPPIVRKAIESIFEGQLWVSRKVLSRIVRTTIQNGISPKLTARESEILRLVSQGLKNQEIADRLFISRDTVRWHLRSLYSKIGVANRTGAMRYALSIVVLSH
jgi:DNA-binding NarL/FixJ family response regulator